MYSSHTQISTYYKSGVYLIHSNMYMILFYMYAIKKPTVSIKIRFIFVIKKFVSLGTNDMYLIQFSVF